MTRFLQHACAAFSAIFIATLSISSVASVPATRLATAVAPPLA